MRRVRAVARVGDWEASALITSRGTRGVLATERRNSQSLQAHSVQDGAEYRHSVVVWIGMVTATGLGIYESSPAY